ncbi:hypothetical protein [Cyanobium gracile]|uniref:hypothetical protein n=1 Tax=Cyanobium gracile TaxID=59930 RepID=UPI0012E9BBA5|nr:hypothetical protein [Cyanobium gracile]
MQEWAADGSLVAAAREALLLSDVLQELERLAGEWALGDFSGLPPIEVLQGEVLPGAAGAYAISTGTIYLNGDWLASASEDRAIAVLNEELGHHLDAYLNASDTPGDEGHLFSAFLDGRKLSEEQLSSIYSESDSAGITIDAQKLSIEMFTLVPFQRDVLLEIRRPNGLGVGEDLDQDDSQESAVDIIAISIVINGAANGLSELSGFGSVLYTFYEYKDIFGLFSDVQNTVAQDRNEWELASSRQQFITDLIEISIGASLSVTGPIGLFPGLVVKLLIDYGVAKPIADVFSVPLQVFDNSYGKIPVTQALLDGEFDPYPRILELANDYISSTSTFARAEFDQKLKDEGLYDQFLLIISAFYESGDSQNPQPSQGSTYLDLDGNLFLRSGVETFSEDIGQLAQFQLNLDGATLTGILEYTISWISGVIDDLTIGLGGRLIITDENSFVRQYTGNIVNYGYVEDSGQNQGVIFGDSSQSVRFVNDGEYALIGSASLVGRHPDAVFRNNGLLRRSGSGESQIFMAVENHGTVEVAEGDLFFASDHTYTGKYVAVNGTINLSGSGTHILTEDAIFEGDNFNFFGARLTGGKFNQKLNWISGIIDDLTIGLGGRLIITDENSFVRQYTGNIVNYGYVEDSGQNQGVIFGDSSQSVRFVNDGEYALIGSASLVGRHPDAVFRNNGLLRRSGSGESQIFMAVENHGTVEVAEGDLFFASDHTYTGKYVAVNGTINLTGSGTHILTEDAIFEGDNFNFFGARLTGAKFTQRLNWISGIIDGLTIGLGGRLIITDENSFVRQYTGNIVNYGYVEDSVQNQGVIFGDSSQGVRFVNNGEYALIGSASLVGRHPDAVFRNNGLLRRSGSGESQIFMAVENHGTVEVAEGDLFFASDHTYTGKYVAVNGTINLSGIGTHILTEDAIFEGDNFNFFGARLTGGKFNQKLNWISGIIDDLTIGLGGRLIITDENSFVRQYTGNIVNYGYVEDSVQNQGVIFGDSSQGVRFVNNGEYALIGSASLVGRHPDAVFRNNGLLRRSGSGESQIFMAVENHGTVEVAEGDLFFASDHTYTGKYVAVNGTINLSGSGTHILTEDAIFEGDNFNFFGARLTGGKFNQKLNWISGIIDDLTIGLGGRLIITDENSFVRQYTGNIVNYGYVEDSVQNQGVIFGDSSQGVRFVNDGEYALIGSASLVGRHPDAMFRNNGLLRRSGSGESQISMALENHGIVEVAEGSIHVENSDYAQVDGLTWLNGGSIVLGQGSKMQISGGMLKGDGVISGDVVNSSIINPGSGIGSLFFDGNLQQLSSGTIKIEIGGTSAGDYDTLFVSGEADFSGSISLSLTNGFVPRINDEFKILGFSSGVGSVRLDGFKISDSLAFRSELQTDGIVLRVVGASSCDTPSDDSSAAFSISGTPAVGAILTASRTADDPDGNGLFSYQWQASSDGSAWQPVGTDAATYQLTAAEQGKQVRVLVAYTDGEGFMEQIQTSPVAVPFVNDGAASFSISGTPAVGAILSASLSTDDPDGNGVFSYQWQSSSDGNSWQAVGIDAATFQLTTAEEGKQVRVVVAYTDGEGFVERVQSTPVQVPFVNDGAATFSISGNPAVGAILSASLSTDDPDGNGVFSYQWQSSSDGNCWQAVGIDVATYQLTAAEEGKQVRVVVDYTDSQGFAEAVVVAAVSVPSLPVAPTFTVTPGPTALVEGDAISATLATSNVAIGTSYFWSLSGQGITPGDFQSGTLSGDGVIGADGTLSINRVIARDGLIEGTETVELRFFADSSLSQQVGSTTTFSISEPLVGSPSNGSDTIIGTPAADIIRGVPVGSPSAERGKGSIDRLTGLGGPDIFVLGDGDGTFYDDGNPLSQGRGDFAVITDFEVGDRIQLYGLPESYLLGSGSYQSNAGVFIYARNPGRPMSSRVSFFDEAIGFVQGARLDQLSLVSPNQFLYVTLSSA